MSLHTTLQQADCRGAKCTPKSPAACRAAGVHTPRCGIDDGTHSSTPSKASRTRTRAHTQRTHAVRTHLPVGRADRVLRVPQGTACGCGCGGRGRADRSMAGFYLPASKAGSCTRGRWWTTYARVLTVAERTRHAIVPGFPASHEHTHAHSLTCTHARTHTHTRTRTHSRNMRAQCFADPFVRSAKLVSLLRFRRDPYSSRQFVYSNKSVTVFRRTSAGDDTFGSGVLRCVIGTRTGLCPATSAPGL